MKASKALLLCKEKLKNNHINSYQIDSLILLCHLMNLSKEQILFNSQIELNSDQLKQFNYLIDRRLNKEPISHIIGKREFFSDKFIVNSTVLDPRADSEILIETILSYFENKKAKLSVLELGVGSGCLLLTILKNFSNSKGIAVDIDEKALETATQNSKLLNLKNHVQFVRSNWCKQLDNEQKFDLIISNPPYIPTEQINNLQEEVKNYEPRIALDGGIDGLDCYRQIAKGITKFLKKEGLLVLEIGQNQENSVKEIFESVNLKLIDSRKDLGGIIRCLVFKQNLKSES